MRLKNKIIFAGSVLSAVAMPIAAISCGSDDKKNTNSPKIGFSNKHVSWIIQNNKGQRVPGTESHDTQAGAEADLRWTLLFNTEPVRIARDSDSIIDGNVYSGVHEINYDTLKVGYVKQDGSVERSKSAFKKYLEALFQVEHTAYCSQYGGYANADHLPFTNTTEWKNEHRLLTYINNHPNLHNQFIKDGAEMYDNPSSFIGGVRGFVEKYDSFITEPVHPYVDRSGQMFIDDAEIVMAALYKNHSLSSPDFDRIYREYATHTFKESLNKVVDDIEYKGATYNGYERVKNAIFSDLGITRSNEQYYRYRNTLKSLDQNDISTNEMHQSVIRHLVGSVGYKKYDAVELWLSGHSGTSWIYDDDGDYVHLTKDKSLAIKHSVNENIHRAALGYHGPSLFTGNWEWLTLNDSMEGNSYSPAVLTRGGIIHAQKVNQLNDFDSADSYLSRLLDTRTFDYSPYFDVHHPHWDQIPAMKFTGPQGETKYFKLSEENFMNIDQYYQINQANAFAYWWVQQGVDVHNFLETLKTSFGYHIAKIEK